MTTIFFISVGQDIIIEEVPRSLLISTGHVGTFSCKSCCTHCHGYWVINDTPALKNHGGQAHLESMGFTFFEGYFNESNQRCHVMVVTINASESVNASSIQCDYCPTADQPDHYCQHYEATLLVIASKCLVLKFKELWV